MTAKPPFLAGALQERLIWVIPLAVARRPVGAPGTEAITSKISESPYMGRSADKAAVWLLERGV